MADTESASSAAARESKAATGKVEEHSASLAQLLDGLRYADEARILEEFKGQFSKYRELDARIVALAEESTNLKARALSFGAASDAARAFVDALRAAHSRFSSTSSEHSELLVTQALLAVREIQVLHAPHIAERQDGPMTRMEQQMADLEAQARAALKSLDDLAPAEARPALADARSALDRFHRITGQIVQLSRRNTNVLALDLSLRNKPALVTACENTLVALQQALQQEAQSTR